MATTRLMPLHTGKGRTVGQGIRNIIDYTENPQKTDGGRLITSWQCDSRIADAEFLFTKNQYIQKTGRVRGEDDVIAGEKEHTPRKSAAAPVKPEKRSGNLLVDIQAKLRAGKGAGYARWATLFNLKQMAQTVAYLQDHALFGFLRVSLICRCDKVVPEKFFRRRILCDTPAIMPSVSIPHSVYSKPFSAHQRIASSRYASAR